MRLIPSIGMLHATQWESPVCTAIGSEPPGNNTYKLQSHHKCVMNAVSQPGGQDRADFRRADKYEDLRPRHQTESLTRNPQTYMISYYIWYHIWISLARYLTHYKSLNILAAIRKIITQLNQWPSRFLDSDLCISCQLKIKFSWMLHPQNSAWHLKLPSASGSTKNNKS